MELQDSLLSRVARGETNAIDECLDRYGGLVWSLACRLSPSASDAEDAVQEIFIDLWRNAGRYNPELAEEATFVSMLARRRLIDRRRKRLTSRESQSLDGHPMEYPAPAARARLELAEESQRATACLRELRENEREVLELAVYHGLPQTQIAERTSLPLGTVKTLIRRGLIQLRRCMQIGSRLGAEGGVPV